MSGRDVVRYSRIVDAMDDLTDCLSEPLCPEDDPSMRRFWMWGS